MTWIEEMFLFHWSFSSGWSSVVSKDWPCIFLSWKTATSQPERGEAAAGAAGAGVAAAGTDPDPALGQARTHCGTVEPSSVATSCQRRAQPSSVKPLQSGCEYAT